MLQGSGPADRDGDGYLPPIRDAFLERKIAVYSFDKPGCGDSTGDWRDYALQGRSEQAAAAVDAMAAHPSIDSGRIGVWGQSQGGWLVQMLASRSSDLAFAIANSGPSLTVQEQDVYGCEHTMRARGHDDVDIERALSFVKAMHTAARQRWSYARVERELVAAARGQPWYVYATVDDVQDWQLICRFAAEAYDPRTTLGGVRCPFLAIYGGRDVLVPAWRSARECGEAFEASSHTDATVVVFPGGDHRIRDAPSGRFVSGYLELLADWAARRAYG